MAYPTNLPKYRCHKIVGALKIADVKPHGLNTYTIVPEDLGYDPFVVDYFYYDRCKPKPGGYFVVYEDGYASYSPAEAFEAGYAQL